MEKCTGNITRFDFFKTFSLSVFPSDKQVTS